MGLMAVLFTMDYPTYISIATRWGIQPYRTPFIDLEYMGVAAECWRKGIDVYVGNPCDVMGRPFTYSPLWLRAAFIPTGRAWTNGMGVCLGVLFMASLYWLLRPRRRVDVVVFTLCVLSTDVAFAIERGNIDVVLFLMLVLAVFASLGSLRVRIAGNAVVLFAGLLKFYPLAALGYVLRERPRVFFALTAATLVILVLFGAALGPELRAMAANIPTGSPFDEKFGAGNLPAGLANAVTRVLPFLGAPTARLFVRPAILAALLLPTGVLAFWWARRSGLCGAFARLGPREEATLVYGALILCGCYFAGQSIAYRGIWALFVVAGIMALWRLSAAPGFRRGMACMVSVVLVLMWEGVIRTALRDTPNDPTIWFSAFWLLRELLWWYLVAFLLGVLAVFAGQTPLVRLGLSRISPRSPTLFRPPC